MTCGISCSLWRSEAVKSRWSRLCGGARANKPTARFLRRIDRTRVKRWLTCWGGLIMDKKAGLAGSHGTGTMPISKLKTFAKLVSLLKALQWRGFSFLNEPLTISTD